MEFEQPSEWKPASQDAEQPDEHGLCWRETNIGLLAFKTNEDNTKMWIQFDSNGNGTEVVFDEEGQAFYVHGDMMIPVPLDEPEQQQQQVQEGSQKPELQSQMTFGMGTAASQTELMAENSTGSEMRMGSEPKPSEAKQAPLTCLSSAAIQEDPGELNDKALTEVEKETAMPSQQATNYRRCGSPGSPALRGGEPFDDELPKTGV